MSEHRQLMNQSININCGLKKYTKGSETQICDTNLIYNRINDI